MNPTFIIIPAFNEQTVLDAVVTGIRSVTDAFIVVVDDGSADPLVVSSEVSDLYLIRHCINLGQGAAIATGIEFSLQQGAKVLVTFDADGQHDPADLDALIDPIVLGDADIVLGSRFIKANTSMPFMRKLLIKSACIFHYLLTGFWMTDAHNGLRAMNRKAAGCISITENRMAHATEIILEIKRHHLQWKEVPVHIAYTAYSQSKGQASSNSLRIFFDVVLHKLFR